MVKNALARDDFFWALKQLCAWHHQPWVDELACHHAPPPYTLENLARALRALQFCVTRADMTLRRLRSHDLPALLCWPDAQGTLRPVLVVAREGHQLRLFETGSSSSVLIDPACPPYRRSRTMLQVGLIVADDADAADAEPALSAAQPPRQRFGFRWFVPELARHGAVWREVLLASLVIQLIALATPLFTQAVIDKVVVHRTESTLLVIALGMLTCTLFSAALSWVRQYLLVHTGNRVDASLGAAVFDHLLQLPPAYFQERATGVTVARLHGIETVREFLAGAAVTLVLDLPFLLIFIVVMFQYSPMLSAIVLCMLLTIVALSLLVTPLFARRLQVQFQAAARNQAFLTETLVGIETVKALQLERQLGNRYATGLAGYLQAGFATRQLANTYNTLASLLEQIMSLLILALGAYTVMHDRSFSIGMLVAFQMFAGRLSQPMLRLVGLWQQFQQARLAVARLGDLMDAAPEAGSSGLARPAGPCPAVEVCALAFRYQPHLPQVYRNFNLRIEAGQLLVLQGPSGCGKSTLARLLLGFHRPDAGRILIDGVDIAGMPVDVLRRRVAVVAQDIMLFSGSVFDNLRLARPEAGFDELVHACRLAGVHEAIMAMPLAYQTVLGERGAGLSGGQKQRIAIARALLKRPEVLVFDEATSALDEPAAALIAQTANRLKGKVTMLFITHAVPRGLAYDAVCMMDGAGAQARARVAVAGSGASATADVAPLTP